jgi:CBS domain-containing protein
LSEQKNLDEIFNAADAGKIAGILNNAGGDIHKSVLAREIMRPVSRYITLDTTIEETMRIMHQSKLDILPVVDDDNTLRGQLSCPRIFSYGVPNFFKQLQTVSFVKYLDPFEKYFRYCGNLKVKDIYDPSVVSVNLESTLMEIIFEMATRFRSRLYVVDKGKLVGEIDRFCIIEKILFC